MASESIKALADAGVGIAAIVALIILVIVTGGIVKTLFELGRKLADALNHIAELAESQRNKLVDIQGDSRHIRHSLSNLEQQIDDLPDRVRDVIVPLLTELISKIAQVSSEK
jgi:predicted PurR-regulated permease PerM